MLLLLLFFTLAGKAPWIEIQTSTMGSDLGKGLEQPSDADVIFVVEGKEIFAHKLILSSACNFFCRVFGLKTPDQVNLKGGLYALPINCL